jgi:hypothetical protein
VSWLPERSNGAYRGSPWAWRFLILLGVVNLARGGIHFFADDGGAGRIAGIDLSHGGDVIVMLFAIMGLDQLAWGAIDFYVALRQRAFVPLVLAITLAKQAVSAIVLWLYKPLSVPAPGKYGAVLTLPLFALALWLSLRPRARAPEAARA